MRYSFSACVLDEVIVHLVGNSQNEEFVLSDQALCLDEGTSAALLNYFTRAFNSEELFSFSHSSDLSLNEVYCYVSNIFQSNSALIEESKHIASFLFEKSCYPQIKTGEFYIARFSNCIFDGTPVNGIGLFKSETKETFLEVSLQKDSFNVHGQKGVNINKLDKGAFIFNSDKESGYQILIVDNTGKKGDARYWVNDFLHVTPRTNSYSLTTDYLKMAKSFFLDTSKRESSLPRAEQVRALNETVQFFKENDVFDLQDYERKVLVDEEAVKSFNDYKEEYANSHNLEFASVFNISNAAYQKQSRSMKGVIKLDKNFHVYIHGGEKRIRRGYDAEMGMSYYQLFFEDEE